MARRRKDRGLTLIEILLALVVLVIGMVGILSLFPAAFQSSTESVEDTNAAIISESVAHNLATAFRNARLDPSTTPPTYIVELAHDGAGYYKATYKFALPKLPDPWPAPPSPPPDASKQWKYFPSTKPSDSGPGPSDPPDQGTTIPADFEATAVLGQLFKLGKVETDWTSQTTENVKKINDFTDSYKQFGFSFAIRNVNTSEYKLAMKNPLSSSGGNYTVQDIQPDCRMYEIMIYVFRIGTTAGAVGGGGGTGTTAAGLGFQRLISTVTKRISIK